jgi:hypothetical protein
MDYFINLKVDDFLKIQENMKGFNKISKDTITEDIVGLYRSYEEIFREVGEELHYDLMELIDGNDYS